MYRTFLNSSSPKVHFITKSYFSTSVDPSASLTLHFLMNSCNLSKEAALRISKQIHIRRTKTPHAVLSLLKSYNFPNPGIVKVITRLPIILLSNPDGIIKPKLEFFTNIGFMGSALTRLITSDPTLLRYSLQNKLLPNYNILKGILQTNENVMSAIRSSTPLLVADLDKTLLPRIKILKENRVSVDVIFKLLTMYNKHLMVMHNNFDEIFSFLKKTGISVQSSMYAHAFGVLARMKDNEWDTRVEHFKKLGWREEEVMAAFNRHPYCMSTSTDKITKNYEFYKRKFGWDSNYVCRNPDLLSFSFERRVLMRYRLLNVLENRGLFSGKVGAGKFKLGEREFLVKYVMKHYGQVQELIDDEVKLKLVDFGLLIDTN